MPRPIVNRRYQRPRDRSTEPARRAVALPSYSAIATLGTLSIGRGLVYILTKGCPVTVPLGQNTLLELGQD